MSKDVMEQGGKKKSSFMNKVRELLPDGGNLNLCLTCGACSAGCPATGLEDMDPRRFLRIAALGLDDELLKSDWVWMCTMCQRCLYACPMNFIDMQPNRSNNYCCGGGGGFLQSGYKEERLEFGRLKDNQIQATGADYCIAGCHNCHAQIHELSEHYGGGYGVIHLWTIICLALGILGENEREYLLPVHKDLALYGA